MVCLDTNIIIDFLKEDKKVIKKINRLRLDEVKLTTTSINTFELFKGALRSSQKDAKDSLLGFLSNLIIINFDFKAGEKAAEIFEELRNSGQVIDALDLFIASIAITNNEELFTGNKKHFEKIPGLKLVGF